MSNDLVTLQENSVMSGAEFVTAANREDYSGLPPKNNVAYFVLAVFGLSFWFLLVVPFASHRETYSWLAGVQHQTLLDQFAPGLSSTYRPLAQVATWGAFVALNPHVFPTSEMRQALLQTAVYGMFLAAWWLIYSAAPQRVAFASVACIVGGVFFSGYVQLFHIYGIFYVPVIFTLGSILYTYARGTFEMRSTPFGIAAAALVFWHPFSTALFLGFYFGFYLETFQKRGKAHHVTALALMIVNAALIAIFVVWIPREHLTFHKKLIGFLASYRTNEVNPIATASAFLLTQITVLTMPLSRRVKIIVATCFCLLGLCCPLNHVPLLLGWACAAIIKLVRMRQWSLASLTGTAALLPFGGGIGSPMYALFAIILAAYATALGCYQWNRMLEWIRPKHVLIAVSLATGVILTVRAGVDVPPVTQLARPLLAERERTYQLESALAWLHNSGYCGYDVAFANDAGNPVDEVESALTRHNRPPAAIADVQFFWRSTLRCPNAEMRNPAVATLTFGGQSLADSTPVFQLKGKYAGETTIWLRTVQFSQRDADTRDSLVANKAFTPYQSENNQ